MKGQSIIELLVGIAIASILIAGSAVVVAPSLQINKHTEILQSNVELMNDEAAQVRSWAAQDWNVVLMTPTSSILGFYASGTLLVATSGNEAADDVFLNSNDYHRNFLLNDVFRNANGDVTTTPAASYYYDPSMKFVIVQSFYDIAGEKLDQTSFFIARHDDNTLAQSSWAGGPGQVAPVTLVSSTFATSSQIVVNASGSIQLAAGTNSCVQYQILFF